MSKKREKKAKFKRQNPVLFDVGEPKKKEEPKGCH